MTFAPSSANPNEFVTGFRGAHVATLAAPAQTVLDRLQTLTTSLGQYREIQSRVIAEIHEFAVRTYHRLAFSGAAESIFGDHQREVDALLRTTAQDVLQKIPTICARLSDPDPEAISQALNSCRRMIKAFADAVQAPEEREVDVDGGKYDIGTDKVLNRIQFFLSKRCASKSRRDRLTKNLRQIHETASKGTHMDVTPDEAKALFLQTYLTLGEILLASREAVTANVARPDPQETQPTAAPLPGREVA